MGGVLKQGTQHPTQSPCDRSKGDMCAQRTAHNNGKSDMNDKVTRFTIRLDLVVVIVVVVFLHTIYAGDGILGSADHATHAAAIGKLCHLFWSKVAGCATDSTSNTTMLDRGPRTYAPSCSSSRCTGISGSYACSRASGCSRADRRSCLSWRGAGGAGGARSLWAATAVATSARLW